MKIRLKIGSDSFIAAGEGVALTVFLAADGCSLSLVSSNCFTNGDIESRFWIDERKLSLGDILEVDIVCNMEATPPKVIKIETAKQQALAKAAYIQTIQQERAEEVTHIQAKDVIP